MLPSLWGSVAEIGRLEVAKLLVTLGKPPSTLPSATWGAMQTLLSEELLNGVAQEKEACGRCVNVGCLRESRHSHSGSTIGEPLRFTDAPELCCSDACFSELQQLRRVIARDGCQVAFDARVAEAVGTLFPNLSLEQLHRLCGL